MTEPLQSHVPSGSALAERRASLQITTAQAASQLLLSQRHIDALEADDPSAFYNITFFEQARRRYAQLLGLIEPSAQPTEAPPETEILPPPAASHSSSAPPAFERGRGERGKPRALLAGILLLLVLGVLAWQGDALRGAISGWFAAPTPEVALPAAPALEPATQGAAEPASAQDVPAETPSMDTPPAQDTPPQTGATQEATKPAKTVARSTAGPLTDGSANAPETAVGDTAYLFEAQRLCWIFARESSGKEVQLTLKAGQRLTLPSQLAYLAVGDLGAVRVWVDGSQRDLSSFSANGRVARLGPAELRALRSGSGRDPAAGVD